MSELSFNTYNNSAPGKSVAHPAHEQICPPLQRSGGTCAAPVRGPYAELNFTRSTLSLSRKRLGLRLGR